MTTHQNEVSVFLCYVDKDKKWLEKLETHLTMLIRDRLISTWHPQQIVPGTHWAEAIKQQLKQASIILLLVSSDFLASDYYDRIGALATQEADFPRIIPIIIRACEWEHSPFLENLAVLPTDKIPLAQRPDKDKDTALTKIVADIRRVVTDLTQSYQQEPPASQSQVWNVPYQRNPYFTGRDGLLDRLEQRLASATQNEPITTRSVALTQPQAIKGLGGIGKTQVAVEYAYRSHDRGYYIHTLWVNAASEETLINSFIALAELLPTFPVKSEADQSRLTEAIKRWLEQCPQRWLLIFDNADDLSSIKNYFPHHGNGSILLTTRAHAVGAIAASIEVETMGFVEGTQLLLRRAQRFENASDLEFNEAGNIVVALDHFPLALDQAGAYIEETQCSFAQYLELYQTHRKDLLAQRGQQTTNYPDSVATTWSLSFHKVEQANPAAAELLRLCAFFAPDMIPEELIREAANLWSPLLQEASKDLFAFNQMMAELLKFSLVKRLSENQALSLHRLVQAVQQDMMAPEQQHQWAERVVRAVNKVFPDDPHDITTWPQCRRYLDQAQACHRLIEYYQLQFPEAMNVLNQTCIYLYDHGLYTISEPLLQRVLVMKVQQLGPEHPHTAISLNNLAVIYDQQGKFAEAEPLYQYALAIYEQQLGPEHPATARSLNNLADLYQAQGKYEQAEPLYQRALAICEQQLGPEHLDTAHSLNNLALLYQAKSKYEQAESLYQRAFAIYEQQLGPEHPHTATNLTNLANLYQVQGKFAEAESLYLSALAICEQQLGPEHPHTATNLNNLAELYRAQGKYEQAEPLYQRALTVREQQLGPEHPDTQDIQQRYVVLLEKMKQNNKGM